MIQFAVGVRVEELVDYPVNGLVFTPYLDS